MRRVLVIDEDEGSAGVFGKALEARGVEVYVIGTPDKGIEKAIEVEPDLIFVNLIFQESNGLKVSKLLHAIDKLRKVPIVMLIAHRRDLDPKYTSTIGVVDVLVRPLTAEGILEKTIAILGEDLPVSAVEEVPAAEVPQEEELQAVDEEEIVPSGTAFEAGGPDFVREADRLIDQAVSRPEGGRENIFGIDEDIPKDDVIHLRRTESAGAAADEISDYKSDEETAMEERNLFEEGDERKDDAIKKSFEDEFEETRKEEPLAHDSADDTEVFDDEMPEEEKMSTTKKILMAAGGVVLVAALAFGALQAKKMFFRDETVKVPAQKQVVKDTLPPAGAPVTSGTSASSPDAKVLPPATETAKTEPLQPPAQPAPPAAPATTAQEKPKAATPAPAAQKAAAKEPEKPKPAEPKAVTKKEAEPKAAAAKKSKAPAAAAKKAAQEKGSGKFALQAGYFSSEKNAISLAAKLKEKGYEAYVVKNEAAGKGEAKTFYRVLIGKFDSVKKAAAEAKAIKQKENLAVVVHHD